MIELFKAKSLKKTRESLTSNVEEKTREKAILKEGIGTNREATCTRRGRTRASLFGTYTPSKMGFAVRGSKKQRGRSMVEMLGVLAIIGVLSIGGIQGYTMAMRKYRANEILNLANKYAFTVYSACQTAMEKDPEHYYVSNDVSKVFGSEYNIQPFYSWRCSDSNQGYLRFTDSGLGALPSGLQDMRITVVGTSSGGGFGDDSNSYHDDDALQEGTALPIGIDFVMVAMSFDTSELCEAVFNISGMNSFLPDSDACSSRHDKGYIFNHTAFVEN